MGHKRLWTLPKSKAWRLIIDELVPFCLAFPKSQRWCKILIEMFKENSAIYTTIHPCFLHLNFYYMSLLLSRKKMILIK
ncbi:MAG: hypothetical protein NTZ27_03665 [Ignavibacteriales bacterium]|nr:hypothetical protein [Ignavibacteriales bacterium]